MPEPQEKPPYELIREEDENTLVVNTIGSLYFPSIEDSEFWMERIVDYLIEVGSVTSIVLSAERNYIYPYEQVKMLNQVKDLYIYLVEQKKILSFSKLGPLPEECQKCYPERLSHLQFVVRDLLKKDPVGAYVEIIREQRKQKIFLKKTSYEICKKCYRYYINYLHQIQLKFEELELIQLVKDKIYGFKLGDRTIYREIFEPMIRPNFMFTRLMAEPPANSVQVESYKIGKDIEVGILRDPKDIKYHYHILPPEFRLSDQEYELLTNARNILAKHKPRSVEFVNPQRMREVFFNISKDLITELAKDNKVDISYDDIIKLSKILVRLTVGFGLVELVLQDDNVEDIYVNAPIGTTPIIVKHATYGECNTNIIPSLKEADAWASRFRMISGRPLDEANPVLDTELITSNISSRASIVQTPLSPKGLSFAFRRHRVKPWTLPLFLKQKYLSPLASGLLSFLIDGSRTLLVAGTRGSGKTSLLGSLMVEIMRRYRVITVEDTLELPVEYLRGLNYNILPMKVRSAIVGEASEMSAEDGIRTTLRLGDSCLIIGEVRSVEAKALYEAMRIGALSNVVAGTIHGESPYGIFDRVVNDLNVPVTSFKATDIIILCNKLRSPDGLHEYRRMTGITEVRKHWQKEPSAEQGFFDLMSYDAKTDTLQPSRGLIEGESMILKSIAARSREWVGRWDYLGEYLVACAAKRNFVELR